MATRAVGDNQERFLSARPFGFRSLGLVFALAILGGPAGLTPRAAADTVYLKNNNRRIEGIVDRQASDDVKVYIRTPNGTVTVFRANIERIDYRKASPYELEGDLKAQQDDLEGALKNYQRALGADPQNEALRRKVEQTKERINAAVEKAFRAEFEKIDKALAARQFDEALEIAKLLADKPGPGQELRRKKLASVYLRRAQNYRDTVDLPKAEGAYREAIKAYPSSAVAQLELAELIANYPTRKDEAFGLYKEGIDLAGQDPTLIEPKQLLRYRHSWAELHLKGGNYREAALNLWLVAQGDKDQQYGTAIDSVIEAYRAIAPELTAESEANAQAVETLRAIIGLRPNESAARILLGRVLFHREKYAEALPLYEQAVRNMAGLAPSGEQVDVRFELSICLRKTGQPDRALVQLGEVLRNQPGRYEAICEQGEIDYELSDFGGALTQFQTGIRLEPTNYRAFLLGGRTLKSLKRYEDALKQYRRLFELRDEHPDYLFEMGLIYAAMDRPENHQEARKTFEKVVEILPQSQEKGVKLETRLIDVYVQLGLVSVKQGSQSLAIEYFDKALAVDSKKAAAFDGKGQAYRELSKFDDAEEFFRKAIAADAKNPDFVLNLGVLYQKFKNKPKEALKLYQTYFERGGTDPQVRTWMAECEAAQAESSAAAPAAAANLAAVRL